MNRERNRTALNSRSAGFQTCCVADFQVGRPHFVSRHAGLETRDPADLEVCATAGRATPSRERADSAVHAPNRREFLRAVSMAGAAAGLGGINDLAPSASPQPKDKALIAITLDL